MRWYALVALSLAAVLPIPARAAPRAGTRVSAVAYGLRITLDVSRHAYPRNAVIPVTLSLRNVSHHAVSIMSGLNGPDVTVLDRSGQAVYDPVNPLGALTLVSPKGPGPRSFRLLARRSWMWHHYVVLHGKTLAARVILGDVRHLGEEVSITQPRLRLRLTRESPPRVILSTSPLEARLIPASPASTPVVSFSQERCNDLSTSSGWVTRGQGLIVPGGDAACTTYTWHAIAGWLDHAVATIAYTVTPQGITVSTTPPPRLQPPDARAPAAGICARAAGAVAVVQLNVDTPSPRCEVVTPEQRLQVVNKTGRSVRVRLASMTVRLRPGQDLTVDRRFGTYLAPGVHHLATSAYAGGGTELWLRT